jgi:hypothetical protein
MSPVTHTSPTGSSPKHLTEVKSNSCLEKGHHHLKLQKSKCMMFLRQQYQIQIPKKIKHYEHEAAEIPH